jgi:xanthine dehydrogenase YagS FAD-binding subunit
MRPFEYASPLNREDAVALLAESGPNATVLAGGTDLLSLMKDDVVRPTRVVSLKSVEGLAGISRQSDGALRIGALTTLDALAADASIRADLPALTQAVDGVRSMQIRSLGTVGGDLCQRPRCWYFRAGFGLLARNGSEPLVPGGDNRYHAIFGDGPAHFVSPSSLAPALVALGAELELLGPNGSRRLAVADFFRSPRTPEEKEHDLAADEIVTEVRIPNARGRRNAVYEVRQKQALDWPLAAAAVSFELDGGRLRSPRVVLGHVAPTPWPAPGAEDALEGGTPGAELAERAGQAAVAGAKPLSMNAYKVRLAQVAVKRAILRAAGEEVA